MQKRYLALMKLTNCILSFLVIIALTACGDETVSSTAIGGYVHFSVDDATQIFQDITLNQYESVFEQPILNKLQELHDSYGLKCTLYIYENVGNYNISQMSDMYIDEFGDNSEWLKIGFHGYDENNPEEAGVNQLQFEESYIRVCEEIKRFAGEESLAKTLRLHYWYATEEMIDFLDANGVQAVLCPDNDAIGYDLTEDENNLLNQSEHGIFESDILYYKTDIRYENIEKATKIFAKYKDDKIIVVFTHAWCFEENVSKIEGSMEWLKDNGYQFTFLNNREGL